MAEYSVLEKYPAYECVIGIEVHVQLKTKSKIFCSCSVEQCTQPNKNICPICAGYPGVLPVLNHEVINAAIKAGLATNCSIAPLSVFARKHYFYPDLPKGYQITQNDQPICTNGYVEIQTETGDTKKVRLMRIHMEEDAGKSIHATTANESFVDLNRAGTPLLEIVSQPDIASSAQARAYLKALRSIVMYLDICTGNMQEGAFRADANVSVRKKGDSKLGTKVELKNINSFKFIADAIDYEIERQILLLEDGGTVKQETRLWDTKEHITKPMRSKEQAADYRYFPEPDLPLVEVTEEWINRLAAVMPELPWQRLQRYTKEYGLSAYEADILIEDPALCTYYEQARKLTQSKQLINWILRNLLAYVNDNRIALDQCNMTPDKLTELVELLDQGVINNRAAQEIFDIVAQTGKSPSVVVKEQGFEQIQDTAALEKIVTEIIAQNPQQVHAYKAGNQKLFGFFVGQAMKKSQGKGNPQVFNDLFKKHLG